MEKSYEKVIEYVKHGIGSGEIQAGEKLLPERELAQKLEISRNSAERGTPDPGKHGSSGEPARCGKLCLRKF